MNYIRVCAALAVFRNPKNLEVIVELNEDRKYGVIFQRRPDQVIFYSWSPFTTDFEEVRESVRLVLGLICKIGVQAYLKEGTFLFEYYNLEGEVVDEDLVLGVDDIERICRDLKRPAFVAKHLMSDEKERGVSEVRGTTHVFV